VGSSRIAIEVELAAKSKPRLGAILSTRRPERVEFDSCLRSDGVEQFDPQVLAVEVEPDPLASPLDPAAAFFVAADLDHAVGLAADEPAGKLLGGFHRPLAIRAPSPESAERPAATWRNASPCQRSSGS